MEVLPKLIQRDLVSDRKVNVGGMMIGRPTEGKCVLHSGVARLNRLLCDGNISTRDGVEVRFGGGRIYLLHETNCIGFSTKMQELFNCAAVLVLNNTHACFLKTHSKIARLFVDRDVVHQRQLLQ